MTIPMPIQERIRTLDADGKPAREIARELKISRTTVAKYARQEDFSPAPAVRQVASLVDAYADVVDQWLTGDLQQPRKQRHTGRRVYDRLVTEHGFTGSYATVQRWVRRWRQARMQPGDGYIELEWEPGSAQADFGEADAIVRGERVTTHMLTVTWPHSNTRYAVPLPGETSECVCEGLRTIFEHVGRVPTRIVFDNATGIGKRIKQEVTTTKLFTAFRLHYRFTADFTNPYSGNEKGSVENAVGFIRRNMLVPVPHVESFAGLTDHLLTACDDLLQKKHYRKEAPISALFADDLEVMRHLPGVRFDSCTWVNRRVDKVGNVDVTGVKYYVGDAYTRQQVHVGLRTFTVEVRALAGEPIATHTRVYGRQAPTVHQPQQLLAGLIRKPGAFHNSPFQQALPELLREKLSNVSPMERRQLLLLLERATELAGFDTAVTILTNTIASGRRVDAGEIEMVATRAREKPQPTSDTTATATGVDLSVYDKFTETAA